MRNANRFKEKSTDGIFSWVVAAVDGLFIKAKAPCAKDTANVIAYYSGCKSPYGINLLTPYPGRLLPPGEDSCNFHLSHLRVKIEQGFGILVSTWGILWRPLRVQFGGRADLITAHFHLHNFLQDEKVAPIQLAEEDSCSGRNRLALRATQRTLPAGWQAKQPAPSRSGETPARAAIRMIAAREGGAREGGTSM
ncbi:unnamed protein product [Ectocarpus sp. CCAP 1310/34]|nr:unnamed protein product [Ectocarpus sp. CCAP 1310/34]